MSLRNRKQIPVCKECHIHVIHAGKYGGTSLKNYAPKLMYDNRLIQIESYVKPGKEYFSKTLEEKGWVSKQQTLLSQEKDSLDEG